MDLHNASIFVKDFWHVIVGIIAALLWALVRAKRSVFSDYVTNAQLRSCKDEIIVRLDATDKENRRYYDEMKDLLIEHLDK